MDGKDFDDLVRQFCTTPLTRWAALRGLVAGAAAALTGARLFGDDAAAQNRGRAKQDQSQGGQHGAHAVSKARAKKKGGAKKGGATRGGATRGGATRGGAETGATLLASTFAAETRCACTDLSPKRCPAKTGDEYTCKLCDRIAQGSVQVRCGNPNTCVCESTACVVGDRRFKKGEAVDVCTPGPCPTEEACEERPCTTVGCNRDTGFCDYKDVVCAPANECESHECICLPADGSCSCEPRVCEPQTKCETDCACDLRTGCSCKQVVCEPETACDTDECICDPADGSCSCRQVVCEPENACEQNCRCNPDTGGCQCESDTGATCTTDEDTEGVCCGDGACCDGCCGDDGTCGPCLAFVTSTTRNGNLGGLNGADAICQDRARAGNLSGTYRAWLSDSTGSPSTRFQSSRQGYRLPDAAQTPLATDWTDLTDGSLSHAINVTELGATVAANSNAWSNTAGAGTVRTDVPNNDLACVNWTYGGDAMSRPGVFGGTGAATATDATWTARGSSPCDVPRRLYCFQQA